MISPKLLLLAVDDHGFEVMQQVKRLLLWLGRHADLNVSFSEGRLWLTSWRSGSSLNEEVLRQAQDADAVLLAPEANEEALHEREQARTSLGQLKVLLNLKLSATSTAIFSPLVDVSPLKFNQPYNIITVCGMNNCPQTLVDEVALKLANQRRGIIHHLDMEHNRTEARAENISIKGIASAQLAQEIIYNPMQFDIVVAPAAVGGLVGSLLINLTGAQVLCPKVWFNGEGQPLVYQIRAAASGVLNPLGAIMGVGSILRWRLNYTKAADLIEKAVANTLESGFRTADILSSNGIKISAPVMGDVVLRELGKMLKAAPL